MNSVINEQTNQQFADVSLCFELERSFLHFVQSLEPLIISNIDHIVEGKEYI